MGPLDESAIGDCVSGRELPFDRHDWIVERDGELVRYVPSLCCHALSYHALSYGWVAERGGEMVRYVPSLC